jgi:hypothetical protein
MRDPLIYPAQRAAHVADGVPARLLSRLERIEYSSAGHGKTVAGAPRGRPPSSPRCNKLYTAKLAPHEARRRGTLAAALLSS